MDIKDGLVAITNEVLEEVQKEAEAIISDAEKQSKETLKKAKEQADQNYQNILDQEKTKAENDRRKITSVTEVEMRNLLLQTKEELVNTAFEKAIVQLKDFVKTKEYQKYLLKLIDQVVKKTGKKNVIVEVNAQDKTWLTKEALKRFSKKVGCRVELADETEDFIGGCKTQTEDGKITYDNTIDNQLQELKPALRVEVAKILFGKEA